jgi:hypothetical protein
MDDLSDKYRLTDTGNNLLWLERYKQLTLDLFYHHLHNPCTNLKLSVTRLNYTHKDRIFIQELIKDKSITIKPADKNLGLVFVDTVWYDNEVKTMLSNKITYQKCKESRNSKTNRIIPFSVETLKNDLYSKLKIITERNKYSLQQLFSDSPDKVIKYLLHRTTSTTEIPNIYLLIKIHKPKLCGRPIIPCTKWITSTASIVCDHLLKEVLKDYPIPWLVKDTKSLINLIEKEKIFHKDYTFISADIASLYTNIDTKFGVKMIQEFLQEADVPSNRIKLIIELLTFVMDNSYLSFKNEIYHQIDGTAMGTPTAPTYADIIVYMSERNFIKKSFTSGVLVFYKRYLDDIVAYVDNKYVEEFQLNMNKIDSTGKLRFEFQSDKVEIPFLDLVLFKGERFNKENLFDIRIYQKKMNLYLYIPFNSFHTISAKKSFILTELIRYIRNNSNELFFNKLKILFFQRLKDRGYPNLFLSEVFNNIFYEDRKYFLMTKEEFNSCFNDQNLNCSSLSDSPKSLCLIKKIKRFNLLNKKNNDMTIFKIPYNPLSKIIPTRKILLEYWDKLFLQGDTNEKISKPIIAYQSNPSLQTMLINSKHKEKSIITKEKIKQTTLNFSFDKK